MNPAIHKRLTALRLSGMGATLSVRLQEAAASRLSHLEFFELLLQDEELTRLNRKCQRRIQAAGFRDIRRLDSFDWAFNPSIDRKRLYELATGRYLEQGRDILMVGPPGVGKSHLAQALGFEAIQQGRSVLYRSIFDVVADLTEAQTLGEKRIERYLKPDLLIIDDMGIKMLPPRAGEHLFEVILRRYEVKSTLMTSNRPIEEWGKLIGDVPAAGAILDRFLHHAELLEMPGKSYRIHQRTRV